MTLTPLQVILNYPDPILGITWNDSKVIKNIEITDEKVILEVELGYPIAGISSSIEASVKQHLHNFFPDLTLELTLKQKIVSHVVQSNIAPVAEVKNIIAVGSGKGGVGKSTVALNLALSLMRQGANVGILDADIYGPSLPLLLGTHSRPESRDQKSIEPLVVHGLQTMSIGYLLDDTDAPLAWRGPMVSGALMQLLTETRWKALDYLIIDLPPGTGDIQLTLAQKIPVSGAVIVTTPQNMATIDAKKALNMFLKLHIPVLGVVENMSGFHCPHCHEESHLFAKGGGYELAREAEIPFAGKIPLYPEIREACDLGSPILPSEATSHLLKNLDEIALRIVGTLSLRPRNLTSPLGKIVLKG